MAIGKRLSTKIKNASFFAACLVVLIHVPHTFVSHDLGSAIEYMLVEGFCRCAVPFFFVVSGFFIAQHIDESGWYKREVCKRCRSLLVPYFLWSIIFSVVVLLCMCLSNCLQGSAVCHEINNLSIVKVFGLSPVVDPLSVQLWYLRFLFTAVLVTPIFSFALVCGKCFCISILLLLFIGNCFFPGAIPYSPIHVFFRHTFVFNGFFYFFLGMVLCRYGNVEKIQFSKRYGLLSFFCGICLVLANVMRLYFGYDVLVIESVVSTMANVFLVFALWIFSPSSEKICGFDLSWMSFPIYLIHYSVIYVVSKGVTFVSCAFAWSRGGGGRYFSVAMISLSMTFLIAYSIRRLMPSALTFLCGGRRYA